MEIFRDISNLPVFNKAIVTIGSFDGVHAAHQKLIHRVNQIAEEVGGDAIIVTFHPHPRSIVFPGDKSLKLLSTIEEKLDRLKKYGVKKVIVVPFGIEFSQQSAMEYVEKFLIEKLQTKYLVVGYDHKFGLARKGDFNLLKLYEKEGKFKLIEIQKQETDEMAISSTNIRNAMNQGDFELVNRLLRDFYLIKGKVIKGDGIGRTIGYPTANIQVENSLKLLPPDGIYACYVTIHDKRYGGMLYIGDRPTINNEKKKVIEVNIFDFNENIYEEIIDLDIVSFIRNDVKLNGLEELKQKLDEDLLSAKAILSEVEKKKIDTSSIATISILNYNGQKYLELFLTDVKKSSQNKTEILVIDNASTDKSISYLRTKHPEVQILELNDNYGFAEGYNKGNKNIQSKYTVLLNTDVKVTENWLDPIIARMEDDDTIGAVQPKILSFNEPEKFEYAGASGGFIDPLGYPFCRGRIFDTVEEDQGQYNDETEIFWASGAALVVRTNIFHHLGGFDGDYFAHQEEIDFCWRMKKAGYKCMVMPSVKIYHVGGGTLDYESPKKTFLNFRNNLNTILKNAPFPKLIFIFMMRLFLDGVAGIKYLLTGKIAHCFSIIKAHLNVYVALPETLFKRNEYRSKIQKISIGKANFKGRINESILVSYYLKSKKHFSQITNK